MGLLKMTPELAKKWADALRSGKYKQGQGYLHDEDEDTYCCLGVLHKIVWGRNPAQGESHISDSFNVVPEVYQLSQEDEANFISMNDGQKFTFERIADYIEKRWCQ